MKQEKKPTNAQLQSRLNKAVIHIDRTKNTKEVYFDDRGLRLISCEDEVIVGTNFHRHVFQKVTSTGYSRPALYIERVIDFALANDCIVKNEDGDIKFHRSFARLKELLKAKEDNTDYNILEYVDWYLFNIFSPLYSIGEDAPQHFHVFFNYIQNIAFTSVYLEEHKDGLTDKQFIEEYNDKMKELTSEMQEYQIFKPMSDEERMKQEVEAMQEIEQEEAAKEQTSKKR